MNEAQAEGAGDEHEAVFDMLQVVCEMNWRTHAKRFVPSFLDTPCPGKNDYYGSDISDTYPECCPFAAYKRSCLQLLKNDAISFDRKRFLMMRQLKEIWRLSIVFKF